MNWKNSLLLFIFVFCCAFAKAQQDSIRVVIECDSLYRPFVDEFGKAIFGDIELDLKGVKQFKIPIGEERVSLAITLNDGIDTYLKEIHLSISRDDYADERYDSETGKQILFNKIDFNSEKIVLIKLPPNCMFNEGLIDNTCHVCERRDSVLWISNGCFMEGENGEMNPCPIFNPYNNPVKGIRESDRNYEPLEGVLCRPMHPSFGECQSHWYCHRCKREY